MKKLAIILAFVFPVLGFGQVNNNLMQEATQGLDTEFDMSVGTSFSGLGNGASGFMSYAFPKLRMSPGDNLEVQAGVLMMNTRYSGMEGLNSGFTLGGAANGNFTNAYAFASGTYQVSDNFTISGSAYKKMNSQNQFQQQVHPQAFNFDAYGGSVRMQYQISENAKIDARFNYQKGTNPFNPYNSYYNSSPFYHGSPFSPIDEDF